VHRRKIIFFALAIVSVGVLLVVLLCTSGHEIKLEVIETRPAQVFDDSGAEMQLVTLAVSVSPGGQSVYFRNEWTKVQAKVAGRWEKVEDTFALTSLGPGQMRREQLLFPGRAESCRVRLEWAGPSLLWRLGRLASRFGLKLPPSLLELGWVAQG
jgi:hypothetical protein